MPLREGEEGCGTFQAYVFVVQPVQEWGLPGICQSLQNNHCTRLVHVAFVTDAVQPVLEGGSCRWARTSPKDLVVCTVTEAGEATN